MLNQTQTCCAKKIDEEQIVKHLTRLFNQGDVLEIRVLEAVTRYPNRTLTQPHIESGYFDYEHIGDIPKLLEQIVTYKGIYFTMNPVKPELLNRAANRIRNPKKEPTTTDGDITERRWLLIDCDPKRPSGIPSSDDEHQKAIDKANEIAEGMNDKWGEPIKIDSGNGAQLLYRIDLPADDGELVKKVLHSFAHGNTDAVDIDVSVFNPARIVRLPGTWNVKGDDAGDRHHRRAQVISYPVEMKTLGWEELKEVAGDDDQEETSNNVYVKTDFDIQKWINEHCSNISEPIPYNGGSKWIFDVCPFNYAHTNKSAVIVQRADGKLGFKCHHNGCAGNDWHKLRELLEPNYKMEQKNNETDLSQFSPRRAIEQSEIVGNCEEVDGSEDEREEAIKKQREQCDKIGQAVRDTIVEDVCDAEKVYTHNKMPLKLLLIIALAVCSIVASLENEEIKQEHDDYEEKHKRWKDRQREREKAQNKKIIRGETDSDGEKLDENGKLTGEKDELFYEIIDPEPQKPELPRQPKVSYSGLPVTMYGFIVAPASGGKDIVRLDVDIAKRLGVFAREATKEGLQDMLVENGSCYLRMNEASVLFEDKNSDFLTTMTGLFEGAEIEFKASKRSLAALAGAPQRKTPYAGLSFCGSIQTEIFKQLAKPELVQKGFMSRCLFCNFVNEDCIIPETSGTKIKETVDRLMDKFKCMMEMTGEVTCINLDEHLIRLHKKYERYNGSEYETTINRYIKIYMPRIAYFLSFGKGGTPPRVEHNDTVDYIIVEEDALERASEIIDVLLEDAIPCIDMATCGGIKTQQERSDGRKLRTILTMIKKNGFASLRDCRRVSHLSGGAFEKAMLDLQDDGYVVLEEVKRGNKVTMDARLTEKGKKVNVTNLY